MPVNRNALIRYKTIDNCLRNRYRQWTLDDLIDACSDALYEYEGIDKGVSRRTVQMDLQMMRSDKLGYHAPIIVTEKKYYTYEDPDYSITNIPLTDRDLGKLTEVVDILKQFKGFSHFQELSGIVQRLEDKIHVSKTKERPVIDMEKNEDLKGLEHIDPVYQAIIKRRTLNISYQSFRARKANTVLFHPALLKEFRNRWFVLGKKKEDGPFILLALDRIENLETGPLPSMVFNDDEVLNYFKDVVGVSVSENQPPEEVKLFIDHSNAPYVLTKPIHHSQQLLERNDQGIIVSLQVQTNFELEREILGFGDSVKVIAPRRLRSRIREKLSHAIDLYQTEWQSGRLKSFPDRLEHRGHIIANHVFTRKEIARIGALLNHYKIQNPSVDGPVYAIRALLKEIPALLPLVVNHNIRRILSALGRGWFLSKAIFFDKPAQSNWYVTWHQDATINVTDKKEAKGYNGWTKKGNMYGVCPPEEVLHNTATLRIHLDDTDEDNGALQVLPGSHKKRMTDDEIKLITQNSVPALCDVRAGGLLIMRPLLLHASSKANRQKGRRVIHLEFNRLELANGLEWAEREEITANPPKQRSII